MTNSSHPENIHFLRCQRIVRCRAIPAPKASAERDSPAPLMYAPNKREKIVSQAPLQDLRKYASLECAHYEAVAFEHRQHDYLSSGKFAENQPGGVYPVHIMHLQIHYDDVRA